MNISYEAVLNELVQGHALGRPSFLGVSYRSCLLSRCAEEFADFFCKRYGSANYGGGVAVGASTDFVRYITFDFLAQL